MSAVTPSAKAARAIAGPPEPISRSGPWPSARAASPADISAGASRVSPRAPKLCTKTLPWRASMAATIGGRAPTAMAGAARAASVDTPTTGTPQASPKARAADTPIRMPVNEPGPTVTATREMAEKPPGSRATMRSTSGSRASAWPAAMNSVSAARGFVSPRASRQAEVAASAVSIARITAASPPTGRAGGHGA